MTVSTFGDRKVPVAGTLSKLRQIEYAAKTCLVTCLRMCWKINQCSVLLCKTATKGEVKFQFSFVESALHCTEERLLVQGSLC